MPFALPHLAVLGVALAFLLGYVAWAVFLITRIALRVIGLFGIAGDCRGFRAEREMRTA